MYLHNLICIFAEVDNAFYIPFSTFVFFFFEHIFYICSAPHIWIFYQVPLVARFIRKLLLQNHTTLFDEFNGCPTCTSILFSFSILSFLFFHQILLHYDLCCFILLFFVSSTTLSHVYRF